MTFYDLLQTSLRRLESLSFSALIVNVLAVSDTFSYFGFPEGHPRSLLQCFIT